MGEGVRSVVSGGRLMWIVVRRFGFGIAGCTCELLYVHIHLRVPVVSEAGGQRVSVHFDKCRLYGGDDDDDG